MRSFAGFALIVLLLYGLKEFFRSEPTGELLFAALPIVIFAIYILYRAMRGLRLGWPELALGIAPTFLLLAELLRVNGAIPISLTVSWIAFGLLAVLCFGISSRPWSSQKH